MLAQLKFAAYAIGLPVTRKVTAANTRLLF